VEKRQRLVFGAREQGVVVDDALLLGGIRSEPGKVVPAKIATPLPRTSAARREPWARAWLAFNEPKAMGRVAAAVRRSTSRR